MEIVNEMNKLWPLIYNQYVAHFGEKEIDEFVDKAVVEWNKGTIPQFWATRINNNNEKDTQQNREASQDS